MLIPKRVKRRKQQRGRMKGRAHKGNVIAYGEYALVATECGWVKSNEIEAERVAEERRERQLRYKRESARRAAARKQATV